MKLLVVILLAGHRPWLTKHYSNKSKYMTNKDPLGILLAAASLESSFVTGTSHFVIMHVDIKHPQFHQQSHTKNAVRCPWHSEEHNEH